MTKAEEKRKAIIAQQAAREVTERASQQASGTEGGSSPRPGRGKWRSNFASATPFGGQRRGRPPKT